MVHINKCIKDLLEKGGKKPAKGQAEEPVVEKLVETEEQRKEREKIEI
jgi:hypothetical protein